MNNLFPALVQIDGMKFATTLVFHNATIPQKLFGAAFIQWPAYTGMKGKELWEML